MTGAEEKARAARRPRGQRACMSSRDASSGHATWHSASEASRRSTPRSRRSAIALAGVVAYYTTHTGAANTHARGIVRLVRAEPAPTIWPTPP